ncbi:MAG: cadherin-like domain-containing protein [Pseudomonadota bacterium]
MSFSNRRNSYELTALLGSDILGATDNNLGLGDQIEMPASARVEIEIRDNDKRLSGDWLFNEYGNDLTGQVATVDIDGETAFEDVRLYAEQFYQLMDEDGNLYILIEIERVGSQSGDRDDFYAFLGDVPPPATNLTVVGSGNVFKGVRYEDLTAGPVGDLNRLEDGDETASVAESSGLTTLTNVLANTVDPEAGDPFVGSVNGDAALVGQTVAGSNGGLFVIAADGTATFDDNGDFESLGATETATTSVSYSVVDADGAIVTSTVTVTVGGVNDDPTGTPTGTLDPGTEDIPSIIAAAALLQGFTDIDGDTLQVIDLVADTGADIADNGDGTFTVTPVADFNGDVTLTYTVSDGNGGTLPGQARTLTFAPANDDPSGTPTGTLDPGTEDVAAVIAAATLLQGFTDIDGDILEVADLIADNGAGVAANGDGTFTITPAADFNGNVTLTYSVSDGNGGTLPGQSRTLTFTPVNDDPTGAPTGTLDPGTEDIAAVIAAATLREGFTDVDGDLLQVTDLIADNGADVIDNGDGTFTITPTADFNGDVTLTYTVSDGNGGTLPGQTRTLSFAPVNDNPTGAPTGTLDPGTEDIAAVIAAATLLEGFTDVDGDLLQVTNLVADNGADVIDNGDGTFTITPAADFNGDVTLTYTVSDGNGGTLPDQTRTLTFVPQNSTPTAIDLSSTTIDENIPGKVVGVFSTTDPDTEDTFTYSLFGPDADLFDIDGDKLRVAETGLDFESAPTRSISVRSTDQDGAFVDRDFILTVIDSEEILLTPTLDTVVTSGANVQIVGDSSTYSAQDLFTGSSGFENLVLTGPGSFTSSFPQFVGIGAPVDFVDIDRVTLINLDETGLASLFLPNVQIDEVETVGTGRFFISLTGPTQVSRIIGDHGSDDVEIRNSAILERIDLGDGDGQNVDLRTFVVGRDAATVGELTFGTGTDKTAQIGSGANITTLNLGDGGTSSINIDGATIGAIVGDATSGADNVTIRGASTIGTISLGAESDVLTLGSGVTAPTSADLGEGDDQLFLSFSGVPTGISVDGGTGRDIIFLSGSGNLTVDLTQSDFTGFERISISGPGNVAIIDNETLSRFQQLSGSTLSTFRTNESVLDLTAVSTSGVGLGSTNVNGTTFLVDTKETALDIRRGVGPDRLEATEVALTDTERATIFGTTSIETIVDATGTYTSDLISLSPVVLTTGPDAPTLTANADFVIGTTSTLNAEDTLIGGDDVDVLRLFDERGNNTVYDFNTLAELSEFESIEAYIIFDEASTFTLRDGPTASLDLFGIGENTINLTGTTNAARIGGDDGIESVFLSDSASVQTIDLGAGSGESVSLTGAASATLIDFGSGDSQILDLRDNAVVTEARFGSGTGDSATLSGSAQATLIDFGNGDGKQLRVIGNALIGEVVFGAAPSFFVNSLEFVDTSSVSTVRLGDGGGTDINIRDDAIVGEIIAGAASGRDEIFMIGNAVATSISLGAGNDTIELVLNASVGTIDLGADEDALEIRNFNVLASAVSWDGGAGSDTLVLADSGDTIDLTTGIVSGFETISLSAAGSQALIDAAALTDVTELTGFFSSRYVTADATLDLTGIDARLVPFVSTNVLGTTFLVDDRAEALLIEGGVGSDTIETSAFAFSENERDLIFATTSVETIVDTAGTFTTGFNAPNTFVLTDGSDAPVLSGADETVIGTAATLNPGDSLNAGDGFDELVLYGSANYSLTNLAAFTGFEAVRVINVSEDATPFLTLGDTPAPIDVQFIGGETNRIFVVDNAEVGSVELNASLQNVLSLFENTFVDSVVFQSGVLNRIDVSEGARIGSLSLSDGRDDVVLDDAGALADAVLWDAGDGRDRLGLGGSGQTYDLTTAAITGFEEVSLFGSGNVGLIDAAFVSTATFLSGSSANAFRTAEATLDLTETIASTVGFESANASGTTFLVDSRSEAFLIRGGIGTDEISAIGFSLSETDRQNIFANSSVELIRDTSGLFGNDTGNTLDANSAGGLVVGGTGADRLVSDIGNDIMTGNADNDVFVFGLNNGNDEITDFVAGAGTDDVLDFSGYATLFSFVADLLATATQEGSDVVFQLTPEDTLTLRSVALANLDEDDFIL